MDALRVYLANADYVLQAPGPYDRAGCAFAPNGKLSLVPVIRAFGATPSGQRVCVHVHSVFPYCYVEYRGALAPDTGGYLSLIHI